MECSLLSSRILEHGRYRLSAAFGRCVLRLGKLRLGEKSQARIAALCLLLCLCLIIRVGSMGSVAAGATDPCRIRNGITAGAARVTLVGHRGRQRLEQPAAGARSASRRGQAGIFISRQLNGGIRMYDYDYLLEIRNPPVDIPAGVSLQEVGHGANLYIVPHRSRHSSLVEEALAERCAGAAARELARSDGGRISKRQRE